MSTIELQKNESFQRESSQWFCSHASSPSAAVLLVHGLNQKPSSWNELIAYLNGLDLHVYRLALKGHRGLGFDDMHAVNVDIWEREFLDSYDEIQKCNPGLPVYLVAYSLGSLVAMSVQLKLNKRLFDRQVLLAPALAIRPYTRLVLFLCRIYKYLPSRSPNQYVANSEGTTSEAYRALFQLEKELRMMTNMSTLNIPTRVMMRRDDELISYRGTARFMQDHGLDKWKMISLVDASCRWRCTFSYKHLIVDRRSAGNEVWSRMTTEMRSFLDSKVDTE